MPNYKVIEGTRENSRNYGLHSSIFIKNNEVSIKIRFRCHRWRDGCRERAHIINETITVMQKCARGPEY